MTESTSLETLATRLCPWLEEPLARLEGAFASGRLGHAWLLTGPRGVGKLNLALVTADRLLSGAAGRPPPEPLTAADAAAAMAGRHAVVDHHPDLHWIHPIEDKRTISIEQVRAVGETLALKGFRGGPKVVIIEPAEAMTVAAANALLKTLEEPSADSYLLLVAHEPQRLPATVRSRCQHLRVQGPSRADTQAWLGTAAGSAFDDAWLLAPGRPLHLAERLSGIEEIIDYNALQKELIALSRNRGDALPLAEKWLKLDVAAVLEWLVRRLELAIRARVAAGQPTAFTELPGAPLHNAWRTLTFRTLFEQHQAAERLLRQVGTGVNTELGLRVLLLGFQSDRGTS